MERGAEIVVPMSVVFGCLGLGALGVVAAAGLGLALEMATVKTLTGPGEEVNRRALEAFVVATRASRGPAVPGADPRS